jgi:hypothetical protein
MIRITRNLAVALLLIPMSLGLAYSAHAMGGLKKVRVRQEAPCESGGTGCVMRAVFNPQGRFLVSVCIEAGCAPPPGPPREIGHQPGPACQKTDIGITVCECKFGGGIPDLTSCFGFVDSTGPVPTFRCNAAVCSDQISQCFLLRFGGGGGAGGVRCCKCAVLT